MSKKIKNIIYISLLLLFLSSCSNPSAPSRQSTTENNNKTQQEKIILPQEFDSLLKLFGKTTDTTGTVIDLEEKDISLGTYILHVTFESNQSELAKGVFSKGSYNLLNSENSWKEGKEVSQTLQELSVTDSENNKIGTKTLSAIVGTKTSESYPKTTKDVIIKYKPASSPSEEITSKDGSSTITFNLEIQVTEK